jgi:hypothetical protein
MMPAIGAPAEPTFAAMHRWQQQDTCGDAFDEFGWPWWARTNDQRIMSRHQDREQPLLPLATPESRHQIT